jgi:hypothetical protein
VLLRAAQCNEGGKGDSPPDEDFVTHILHCYLTALPAFRDGVGISGEI